MGEMNAQSVTDKLINPATLAELTPTIETHIDQFLRVKLLEKMPFLSTFLGESTLAKLKVGMMEEIELLLPEVMVQYINKTSAGDDASSLMQEKLQGVDVFQMANTIRVSLSAKITAMKWLVVCIGAIIGLLQLAILLA
ncbi:MAG: hypothetical protein EOP51_12310 [Sphingobacteriales bacterium]|nr:MAG: hypothetical protein EOP51_12310 [Sphingobacteriales bacterium]